VKSPGGQLSELSKRVIEKKKKKKEKKKEQKEIFRGADYVRASGITLDLRDGKILLSVNKLIDIHSLLR